jgi:hypothetical protein
MWTADSTGLEHGTVSDRLRIKDRLLLTQPDGTHQLIGSEMECSATGQPDEHF